MLRARHKAPHAFPNAKKAATIGLAGLALTVSICTQERASAQQPSPQVAAQVSPSTGAATPASNLVVIIYGAEWCKPCHQAADYLKSKGIAYIQKDIDESREAAVEMREKLERAGRRGGSIL